MYMYTYIHTCMNAEEIMRAHAYICMQRAAPGTGGVPRVPAPDQLAHTC